MAKRAHAIVDVELFEGWSEAEPVGDTVKASGLTLRRAGLSATNARGIEVVGSAVEIDEDPQARARFELLERIAVIEAIDVVRPSYEARSPAGRLVGWVSRDELFPESEAPDAYRHARSNGVALHLDFALAAERAVGELAERDRVLRAWLGETRPEPIALEGFAEILASATDHAFRAVSFPAPRGSFSSSLEVVGVFGFPSSSAAPLAVGYAARSTRLAALEAAAREALQQLGFLTGETIPDEPPALGPTPLHHIEHWLYPGHHAILQTWLDEGHRCRVALPSASRPASIIDITPGAFRGRYAIVKAVSPSALPVVFGAWPLVRDLAPEVRVHPIL
jgi:hypothetical protein